MKAVQLHKTSGVDRFNFELAPDGKEYVALFSRIAGKFFKKWEVIVVTPIDDFVGALQQTNRKLIWLMAALVVLESAMIYIMAKKISRYRAMTKPSAKPVTAETAPPRMTSAIASVTPRKFVIRPAVYAPRP